MVGGFSGCRGILLYDTEKTEYSAVYGYYDEREELIIKQGSLDEMKRLQKETDAAFSKENDSLTTKITVGLFLGMLAAVIAFFIFAPLTIAIGIFLFCAIGYFPLLVIIFANLASYKDERSQRDFRRFHGCEHALINIKDRKTVFTKKRLERSSIYHRECGTAYCGYALFLAAVIALLVFNIGTLGILKTFLLILITVVLLFLNIFNPVNPFVLLQRPAIAKPTDREYALGIAVANTLWSTNEKS